MELKSEPSIDEDSECSRGCPMTGFQFWQIVSG